MGYLELDGNIPDFSTAVISLWFRVPAASFAAAVAQWESLDVDTGIDAGGTQDSNLPGMIPLVTFGPNPTATSVGFLSLSSQISPSFIGINCGPQVLGSTPNTPSTPSLVAHFAYANQSNDFTFFGTTHHNPKYIDIGFDIGSVTFFSANFTIPTVPPAITVAPDVWHHVLISFDLGSGCFPGKFYLAFDDVNYSGDYLFPSGGPEPLAAGAGSGANDIVSSLLATATNGALETSSNLFGIPINSANVSRGYKVETAEFQMFTGITPLDTSIEDNRRAFITTGGTPANMYLAEALIGQPPDIKLHGSNNWTTGANTGSLGTTFTPTGTITSYSTAPDITP